MRLGLGQFGEHKMEEKSKYNSFNVLARKALIAGIPIYTLLIGISLAFVTGFGGVYFFGLNGLVFPSIIALILLGIRLKCENDSRAMESFWWDIKGAFYRLRCQSSVLSFTSIDSSPSRRNSNVREWFKNNTSR